MEHNDDLGNNPFIVKRDEFYAYGYTNDNTGDICKEIESIIVDDDVIAKHKDEVIDFLKDKYPEDFV